MTRFRRFVLCMIPVIFLVTVFGCNSDDAVGPAVQFGEVRVTGIWIRDQDGEIRGVWGRPEDGGLLCYPNPFNPVVAIKFSAPAATQVTVWVSKALGPGDAAPEPGARIGGAVVYAPSRTEVRVLADQQLPAGIHQVVWDGRDSAGRPAPGGFYRIYAQVGQALLFADVFMYRGEGDPVPPGMGEWLYL